MSHCGTKPLRHRCAMPPPGLRYPASASLSLASCWPLPQQLLPVSAAGGGRRRCTLAIFSGRILFNFASPKRLRSFRRCLFTERGRTGKRHLCQKAQKSPGGRDELLPSKPAGLPPPSVREALAKPEALHLSRKLCRCSKAPSLRGLSPQATGGVCPQTQKAPEGGLAATLRGKG